MAPVVQFLQLFVLTISLSGALLGQSANQSPLSSDVETRRLQDQLAKQRQAISQGDPSQVIASSQTLTELAFEDLSKVHSDLKQVQRPSATAKQLAARERELRKILGSAFDDWGTAEARQRRYREALGHFQDAERWYPSTPGVMRNLGTAAFRLEEYGESVRALSAAIAANPSDQSSRLMLAMSQFSLEQFAEASKNFTLVSEAVLEDPRATYAWAYSLIRTNQPQQGNTLAGILEGTDLSPDVRLLVCKLYTASENYEQALKCLRTLEASAESAEVQYQIGATLIRMNRPADAIADLKAALKIDPRDADSQYDLAFALLQTSQKEEGIAQLRSLVAANPNYPQAQYQLGKVLLESGQTAEAIPYLEAAATLGPKDDFVHYQLQVAYRRSGRVEDADRELKKYKQLKASARDKAADRLNQNSKP
ncbi:tetratricopeptide repeat protein [Edaphobacter modestus]|uniref:Tetratricopeptide repeat protein n=1 Tax=Edaphobacter modestus TaxID=388466 RepID=A0A4Q7YSK0_9BACT|nr:tetratricopeptide repeat protein [Edaphobacter modestus]RZU39923.1 tetratricopeptide repeat protein [Edaphobacter modestus]